MPPICGTRDVALVGEDDGVVGEVLEQGRRRLAGLAAGEVARIVLDAGAGAGRLHHLEVERACAARAAAPRAAGPRASSSSRRWRSSVLDALDRLLQRRPRRHVVRVGVDLDALSSVAGLLRRSAGRTRRSTSISSPKKRDAPGAVLEVGGEELERVAAHAEGAALEVAVVALVLQRDEVGDQLALRRAAAPTIEVLKVIAV